MSEQPPSRDNPAVRFDRLSRTLPPPEWLQKSSSPWVGTTMHPPPVVDPDEQLAAQGSSPQGLAASPEGSSLRPAGIPFTGEQSRSPATGASDTPPPPPTGLSPSRPPPEPAPGHHPGPLSQESGNGDTMVEQLVPRTDEEAAEAVAQAIAEFKAARSEQLAEARKPMLSLIELIVRRVFADQVHPDPGLLFALVEEGLSTLAHNDRVCVRVGSFFADATESLRSRLGESGIACEALVDSRLPAHGCVIESELGRVDESLESRLDHILRELADSA